MYNSIMYTKQINKQNDLTVHKNILIVNANVTLNIVNNLNNEQTLSQFFRTQSSSLPRQQKQLRKKWESEVWRHLLGEILF